MVIGKQTHPLRDNSNPDDVYKNLGLAKGQEVAIATNRIEDIEHEIGWRPTRVGIYGLDGTDEPLETLLLLILYKDAFEKSYSRLYAIRLDK
jgi:hypothetical protein